MVSHFLAYIAILIVAVAAVHAKRDHPVLTYFKRVDEHEHVIDRRNENYEIKKPFSNFISPTDKKAKVKIWPSHVKNGESVTILWSGVENTTEKDFIAFYCPANDTPEHYLDYFYVSTSSSWKEGYGHNEVTVFNMRSDCIFKYYRSGSSYSQLVAISQLLTFDAGGKYAPLQRHIALTGDATEMRIMWNSAKVNLPVVKYGRNMKLKLTETNVKGTHYNADDMCLAPANATGFWDPGYTYVATLTNLKPNKRYYYAVGSEMAMSDTFSFMTPIQAGKRKKFKFIIYGDMGVEYFPQADATANLVMNEVAKNDIKFILHHGDISYARGYAYIWEQWHDLVQPYAQLVPYMVSIGNHEYDHTTGGEKDPSKAEGKGGFRPSWFNGGDDSGGECGVPMYNRFRMPDTGHSLWWYSFDYGMVHIIMISTEHNYTRGSPMYEWLKKDLQSVDRSVTPWVLIAGHRAMYASAEIASDYKVAENMQILFEDLIYEYKVDMAFWAHYHSYERTCILYKNKCQKDGILHIVVGSGGKSADAAQWYTKEWSIYRKADYGYGRVTVANENQLLFEWVNNRENKVLDYVWLKKNRSV